jgi:hypothetical protein
MYETFHIHDVSKRFNLLSLNSTINQLQKYPMCLSDLDEIL